MTNNSQRMNFRRIASATLKWMILLLPMVAYSCYDGEEGGLLNDADEQSILPAGAIEISPFDQTLDLADLLNGQRSTSNVQRSTFNADFLTSIDAGHIYVEQNDDGQWRTATVTVTGADGTETTVTLAQPPASRASGDVRRSFYRHHALGYSYDALTGEYCSPNYVRCQLLNRVVIDELEKNNIDQFINIEHFHRLERSHEVFNSIVDYAQNSNFSADAEGEALIIFEGSVEAGIHAFEEGLIDTYIVRDKRSVPCAHYTLFSKSIAKYVESHPQVLTSSFRKALKRLEATPVDDWRAVDEFLEVYGSHIVTDVELGGCLTLDVQVETHKFDLEVTKELLSEVAISKLFENHSSSSSSTKEYEMLRNCKCVVDLVGGDMNILDEIIGMTTFSSDNITISEEDLNRWERSVYFDDDDLANSNVEMTAMQVVPIWELIANKQLADRISSRVYSNAATMQKLLGNRNFINVVIPYSKTKFECRVGNQKYTFTNPDVTDIVVAGRYVATICNEPVPEITEKENVRVIYPIYEGHVKLGCGLCIYKGVAYQVEWDTNKHKVTKLEKMSTDDFDGNIYMNGGKLSITPMVAAEYMEGHPVVGVERPGGIDIEGKLAGTPVRVKKYFGHFYLNNKNRYDNLPNWSFVAKQPIESHIYPEYFDGTTWKDRMVRNDDFMYILNTTEIGYE